LLTFLAVPAAGVVLGGAGPRRLPPRPSPRSRAGKLIDVQAGHVLAKPDHPHSRYENRGPSARTWPYRTAPKSSICRSWTVLPGAWLTCHTPPGPDVSRRRASQCSAKKPLRKTAYLVIPNASGLRCSPALRRWRDVGVYRAFNDVAMRDANRTRHHHRPHACTWRAAYITISQGLPAR